MYSNICMILDAHAFLNVHINMAVSILSVFVCVRTPAGSDLTDLKGHSFPEAL